MMAVPPRDTGVNKKGSQWPELEQFEQQFFWISVEL